MQLSLPSHNVHLTYCTNIHAGESWDEVSSSLDETIPVIRKKLELSNDQAFGIGLRLSAQAADSLILPARLDEFKAQLARLGAYVFTINAFPYGPFHTVRVKEQVYLPDWRDGERLRYTRQCAYILAALLPEGMDGSISTVPGAYKSEARTADAQTQIVEQLIAAVAMLAQLEQDTGKYIALALEPEPCCFLETLAETTAFFCDQLWATDSIVKLADLCISTEAEASHMMRRHLGVCYDVCHAAVEFEDPVKALQKLSAFGIRIPKIQLSCALRIPVMHAGMLAELQRFDDGVYLHQVVVQKHRNLQRYTDLPAAMAAYQAGKADGEWRIHCHVPIFWDSDGQTGSKTDSKREPKLDSELGSTRADLLATLQALRKQGFSSHLEVETYTWDVLPAHLKNESKAHAIARELGFIMKELLT
ncbi:metabolite traffic protein EboE [Undibacterium sp. CY18W]|uniref:Metabolite traffic protein EboE n=1 Tax=Undibacterium hunanense TaxID=2762292 RepID=A0ABR6ZMM5_9BURK|nr:metabolite traffic protein EboE [Undibacterium hunanense]MBC3917156.1 metabolite traffic protein EboE [Undibacterium hunanense]